MLLFPLLSACSPRAESASPASASRLPHEVVVDTDLGGDPDDIQSLVRLLHYSDVLRIRAIISTPHFKEVRAPWDTLPRVELIRRWIRHTDLNHLRARGHAELMAEDSVLSRVYAGSQAAGPPAPGRDTPGSRALVQLAREQAADRPLWVLVWGSMTTLAQALHDAPEIAPRLRIYAIGSTNTLNDSLSRNFVHEFMETTYPDLWWIENGLLPRGRHETFRGVYQGGFQAGEWGMTTFVDANVRGHGTDRQGLFDKVLGDAFPLANWPRGSLKEGDSPSMLYLLSPVLARTGDVDDPTRPSWGGRFRRADSLRFPNYYVDLDLPPDSCQATIARWRRDFLGDWKKRWDWYEEKSPAASP